MCGRCDGEGLKIEGALTLPGSPGEVWTALHDPDTLARSIPACKGVERVDDEVFRAVFDAEFGGMKGSYEGEIRFLRRDARIV